MVTCADSFLFTLKGYTASNQRARSGMLPQFNDRCSAASLGDSSLCMHASGLLGGIALNGV